MLLFISSVESSLMLDSVGMLYQVGSESLGLILSSNSDTRYYS